MTRFWTCSTLGRRSLTAPLMAPLTLILALAVALTGLLAATPAASAMTPKSPSRVFLNGVATPVYFNDGDSFEVLAGELKGTRARLAGYNTLESFGPVHRWGDWHAKELYTLAKMATMNARRGVWHCESEMERDTYGRILWFCLDLAVDQVHKGLAHAMTVDENPGVEAIVEAQRDAIANRRGIWAHGTPSYIMTSLHSISEGGGKSGKTYNRLVSAYDGHSASISHTDAYAMCEWVCSKERAASEETIRDAAKVLEAKAADDPQIAKHAQAFSRIAREFSQLGYFVGIGDDEDSAAILAALQEFEAHSELASLPYVDGSCVLYVPFESRFNQARAECLR